MTAAVAGLGSSGDRRSSAAAAVTTRWPAPREVVELGAASAPAAQPIETWSSCRPRLGIESTLAGWRQPLVLAHQRRGGVLRDHEPRVQPGLAPRNVGSPSCPSRSRSVRRSEIHASSAAAIAAKSRTYATGAPWKFPLLSMPPSSNDERVVESRRASRFRARRWRGRARPGMAPWTCGTHRRRVGVLHLPAVPVRLQNPAVFEQLADVRGHGPVPRVRADG